MASTADRCLRGILRVLARLLAAVMFVLGPDLSCHAQGGFAFRNLDFEAATVPLSTPAGSFVPVSQALPGWNVYIGTDQQTTVMYNTTYLDSATVALIGPGSPTSWIDTPLQGSYSAVIMAGVYGFVGNYAPVAISQTGVIPTTAKSLLFTSYIDPGSVSVTIGGNSIPLVAVQPSGAYAWVYGGNISAYAGQTAELRFTDQVHIPYVSGGPLIDNIVFSNNPIPEPTPLALGLCGMVTLGFLTRYRRL